MYGGITQPPLWLVGLSTPNPAKSHSQSDRSKE